MVMLLQEMRQDRQEFKEMFLQTLQRPPEKSLIQLAYEQKQIDKIINSESKGFDVNEFTQSIMTQGAVMAGLGEAFNKMIFREPPAPPEPDTWDRIMQVASHPVAGQVVNKLMEVGDAFASVKLDKMSAEVPHANPNEFQPPIDSQDSQDPQDSQDSVQPMQALINEIIDELESENPLDNTNETIKELQTEFPKEYGMIRMMCKGLDTFDEAFGTLLESTVQIQPYPFSEFLDIPAMQTAGKGVYLVNERGEKMKKRLEEFYNYVRTT